MRAAGDFLFRGHYRVQSRSSAEPSTLAGHWEEPRRGVLYADELQELLQNSQRWQGRSSVALAPALVARRSGAFAREPDALIYQHSFRPAPGTPAMQTHVLDVTKLAELWERRLPMLAAVFDEPSLRVLASAVGRDPRTAATNEYLCHEAGHASGFDVDAKYAAGYFRLGSPHGRVSWPLVFTEELRADLLSFHYALRLLPPSASRAVFAYQVLHRCGLAAEDSRGSGPGAGAVPYLLLHALRQLGFLSVDRRAGRLSIEGAGPGIGEVMELCVQHADEHFRAPAPQPREPLEQPLDEALRAARYFRARVTDQEARADYQSVFPRPTGAASR